MAKTLNLRGYAAGVLVAGVLCGAARADVIMTAVNAASNKLVSQQSGGLWSGYGATGYNGTILSGLVNSYNNTGNNAYKTAAQNGATALIADVNAHQSGIYLGDELYALTQVAGLQVTPAASTYHAAANNFFGTTITTGYGNSTVFINSLTSQYGQDKTQPTIYLSYLTIAAYAVDGRRNGNATNYGAAYRSALISTLGKVADTTSDGQAYQYYPTAALGAAVWALAQTGNGLDNTPITGPVSGQNVFGGHVLSDLPAMLDARLDFSTHTFDYLLTDATYKGYTEDTAFGILGLDAFSDATHSSLYAGDIAAARLALTAAVNTGTGDTFDNSLSPSLATSVYAGRTLQALETPEPTTAAVALLGSMGLLLRRRKTK